MALTLPPAYIRAPKPPRVKGRLNDIKPIINRGGSFTPFDSHMGGALVPGSHQSRHAPGDPNPSLY